MILKSTTVLFSKESFLRELLRYGLVIGVFGALFGTFMWDDARVQAGAIGCGCEESVV